MSLSYNIPVPSAAGATPTNVSPKVGPAPSPKLNSSSPRLLGSQLFPPPPPLAPAVELHPSHTFIGNMMPLADQMIAGMEKVEQNHPLAEVLYETLMTLRETLNLYAISSPSLLAAQAQADGGKDKPLPSPSASQQQQLQNGASSSSNAIIPAAPRLHDAGLESLFTRTQKVQTMLQQRMWIDRSAMTHRTSVDVAIGTVQSAAACLTTPGVSNLNWQTFVVYKKGHELLALDSSSLTSLNLSSISHLTCSFVNASNVAPILAPAFASPYKLLFDLRWITGVKEVNAANSGSHKELGCELLLKFVDALPMGANHGISISTGPGCGPQMTPERFVHLRFATDADRQRLASICRQAAQRNAISAMVARGTISERVALWRENGFFPQVTSFMQSLTPLEGAFLFFPRFLDPSHILPNGATITGSNMQPVQVPTLPGGYGTGLLTTLPTPITPAQAVVTTLPFVNTFPVIWPSRESTLLAKQKARVLEVVVYPHQITPTTLAMLGGGNISTSAWNGRTTNILRIWKHAHEKSHDKSSNSSSNSSSQGGSAANGGDGASIFNGRMPMTGSWGDQEEKECSVVVSANELVDFRFNIDTLELELTCYVTKHSSSSLAKEEGAYNGRKDRNPSIIGPPPGHTGTLTPQMMAAVSNMSSAPGGAADLLMHSKYITRKFVFHSTLHLKKFLDVLRWMQLTHKDQGPEKLRMDVPELRIREWEIRSATKSQRALTDNSPVPAVPITSHLSTLFSAMYNLAPTSRHAYDLYMLTKDLPHTREGALERLQLLVRKLYACGMTAQSIATQLSAATGASSGGVGVNISSPQGSPVAPPPPERQTGVERIGEMRALVCTCPNNPLVNSAMNPGQTIRGRPVAPSPTNGATGGFGQQARPLPSNNCYLMFYQAFLRCHGFQDLWYILVDASFINSMSAMKRWALRGIWCMFEYIKPLVSSSSVPIIAAGGPTATLASGPKLAYTVNNNIDLNNGQIVNHAQLTNYSLARCRTKLLTVWDEDSSALSLPQLFRGNFSACITSLIDPANRTIVDNQVIRFHDSFIDVLFEIAVNNIRLDMVYSSTSTIEPVTTYFNEAPSKPDPSAPAVAPSFGTPLKRESRVQLLQKPIVNIQLIPIILHLLPYSHMAATVMTLENFTWLLAGNSGNIRELLWNLECANLNVGGNLFVLLGLANQYMEGSSHHGGDKASRKQQHYSTAHMVNSLVQKGAWEIFLDTSTPESSIVSAGDSALIFNLSVTLFTTLHYHSMLVHLNASNLFLTTTGENGQVITPMLSTPGIDGIDGQIDTPERVRFRSNMLYRTMDSLRQLNGWSESTTSVFRVMCICLLNVLRSEARTFTSNFDLGNSSSNNFALNQFLILLYVIEEFIFFRPLLQAVSPNGPAELERQSSLDASEGGEEYSQLGLHFDFGDDFDWNELAETQKPNASKPGAPGNSNAGGESIRPSGDSKGNLGRVLDVPVIDKILDVFIALKLATPPTVKGGSSQASSNNTSSVVGDGSADKYEKKILDLFGREYKLWSEYRSLLNSISKATMSQNHKLQQEAMGELFSLVRTHQSDRLKNLTSLANYSKKSSGFFGSAFASAKTNPTLKAKYGIKDANGVGITLHPHLFQLINKVLTRVKLDALNAKGQPQIPGSPLNVNSSLVANSKPRSRQSIVVSGRSGGDRAEQDRAAALLKAKRSFHSIRHAKEFCEKERRRSDEAINSLYAREESQTSQSRSSKAPSSSPSPPISSTSSQQPSPHSTLKAGQFAAMSAAAQAEAQKREAAKQGGPPTVSTGSSTSPSPPSPHHTPTNGRGVPPPVPPMVKQGSGGKPTQPPPPPPTGRPPTVPGPPPMPRGTSSYEEEDEDGDNVSEMSVSNSSSSASSERPRQIDRSPSMCAFSCTICSIPLPASAFWERNGNAYCSNDFIKTFLSCMVCNERIIFTQGAEETPAEKEARQRRDRAGTTSHQYLTLSEERIVHNKCLKCDTCQKPLAPVVASKTPGAATSVSLFQHSGKYYCQQDYFANYGHSCTYCGKLIATNQSIQLAPEDDPEDPDAPPGVTAYFHLECFVCTTCGTDLRELEAAQDEADELAFEAGIVIDPDSRPPTYQSDTDGRVYCWPHWQRLEQMDDAERSAYNGASSTQQSEEREHAHSRTRS